MVCVKSTTSLFSVGGDFSFPDDVFFPHRLGGYSTVILKEAALDSCSPYSIHQDGAIATVLSVSPTIRNIPH
jgi:hypothetical protein